MFASTIFTTFAFASAVLASYSASYAIRAEFSSLDRRATQVPVACYVPGPGDCACPEDLNSDVGVLINVFPGYQCAYPGGACTWDDGDGALQNTQQTNCPTTAPCPASGCSCPIDNNADTGVLINAFKGYQCAYTGGACMWDGTGALVNTHQTNCPTHAKCEKLSS